MKAQRLEGDLKQHHVTLPVDLGLRMPDGVKRSIEATVLREQSVLLDPVRVGEERVGMAMIVEGIEKKADLVVVVNQFATQHAGPHKARFGIDRHENDIKLLPLRTHA